MDQKIDVHRVFADCFKPYGKHIQAAAFYVSKKLSDGHICFSIDEYNKDIRDGAVEQNPFLEESEELSSEKLNQCCVSNSIDEVQPFVVDQDRFYLQRYFYYETALLKRINNFIKEEKVEYKVRAAALLEQKDFIQVLFNSKEKTTNWQLVAALTSILYNFSIITGGPGTGKTTTVAKLLAILYQLQPDLKVTLCAPTGKAAARMNESLQKSKENLEGLSDGIKEKYDTISAGTIHRLLGYIKDSPYFKHNEKNQLQFDVIIIDESSMVDVTLMSKLLDAIPSTSRVIFLGDKEQLASVEAGSIFGDLCLSEKESTNHFSQQSINLLNELIPSNNFIDPSKLLDVPSNSILKEHIIELQHSYRFKGTEGIGKFSKQIISGKVDDLDTLKNVDQTGECVIVHTEYKGEILNKEIDLFSRYLKEKDIRIALDKLNEVRILCGVKQGQYGVNEYNSYSETYLKKKGLISPKQGFYHNQPIMVTKNNNALKLYNGDIGIIREDEFGKLQAYFEDIELGVRSVLPGYITNYTTVFAMTIHKSQGSEFNHVVVVLPDDPELTILTRELLYTAVTRAKKKVFILGKDEVVIKASKRKVQRASGVIYRLS
jgi:exodeoxyribonuclease V alpha subunit